MQVQSKFVLFSVKLVGFIFSEVSVCSNACVGPLTDIKIFFFLLSICEYELISTSKVLPTPLPTEKNLSLSNPIPYSEYLYLSTSALLVKVTAPNKQLSSVG